MVEQNLTPEMLRHKAFKGEKRPLLTAVLIGLAATALCFGWLCMKTHYLYKGNWTGILYTGADRIIPPELKNENIYTFPGLGYDAHFYHLIAHDPLFKRGFSPYVETARTRYRRILVPGLAALLSFGHANWVDGAYVFVVLAFIFLGTFWFTRWSMSHGFSPAWGFLFLAIPSTLITVLLLVIDGALAALTVGFIWYADRRNNVLLFLVLACAALTREIGIFLIIGYCVWLILQRQPLRAVVFGTAAIPAALWCWFVHIHTKPDAVQFFSWIPLRGVYLGIVGHYSYSQPILLLLDFVAIGGMLLGFAFAAYYIARPKTWNPATFMAAGFLLLGIFLSHWAVWPEVNAFGRYYSPLLVFIGLLGMARGNWWTLAPIALVDLRIVAVFLHHGGVMARAMLYGNP